MRERTQKLTLRKETLRELDHDVMREVAGGAIQTLIATRCNCTGYYPSLNAPCTGALSIQC
ncbi:MAG TPA: class I lanthipeptide [Candidatus Dormibacteraeota bacterium]